jgi:hypothetical protein
MELGIAGGMRNPKPDANRHLPASRSKGATYPRERDLAPFDEIRTSCTNVAPFEEGHFPEGGHFSLMAPWPFRQTAMRKRHGYGIRIRLFDLAAMEASLAALVLRPASHLD